MKYFKDITDLEELRKQYKTLLKKFHPDNRGSEDDCKNINIEYEEIFKNLKNNHEQTKNENSSWYDNMKYNYEEDSKLRDAINKIITFENIIIEICGQWIWVSGDTRTYKEEFKAKGFKFSGNKKMWYWHSDEFRKKGKKSLTINEIRNYYGSSEVEKKETIKQLIRK